MVPKPASAPPLFRADKIQIGLKIISALEKKVDIASLIVESPRAYITIGPDGSTNIPRPKLPRFNQNVMEDLLDLHVQHIELRHGVADYNSWRVPLDAIGEHLQMSLVYEPAGPRYLCAISSGLMRVSSPKLRAPTEFALDSQMELGRNTIQVLRLNLASGGMKIDSSGTIVNLYSPVPEFRRYRRFAREGSQQIGTDTARSARRLMVAGPRQRRRIVSRPVCRQVHRAVSRLRSTRHRGPRHCYEFIRGHDSRQDQSDGFAALRSRWKLPGSGADRRSEAGNVERPDRWRYDCGNGPAGRAAYRVSRWSLQRRGAIGGATDAFRIGGRERQRGGGSEPRWEIRMPAVSRCRVRSTSTTINARETGLGDSQLDVGSTHAGLSGTLGENLAVHVVSRNLNDALPVLRAFGAQTPSQWPVELQGGVARIDGSVQGGFPDPRISGTADASKLKVGGRQLDHVTSTFTVDRSSVVLQAIAVEQGKMRLEGNGRAGLRDWNLEGTSPVSATVSLRGADIPTLAAETGWKAPPASGLISASVHVSGSLESPLVAGAVTLDNLTVYDEHFGEARADVTYTATALELTHGEARSGSGRITLTGGYNHPANDWKDGSLRFDVATSGIDLNGIQHLQDFESGLGGRLDLKASGGAKIVNGVMDLTSLNGDLTVRNAALDGRSYGNLTITAATKLPLLTLSATATLDDVQIHGSGEWRMEGDYRGEAHVPIPRISLATLHDWMPGKHVRKDLPFGGFIEGDAVISGPLNQPSAMKADVTLSTVQLNASPDARPVSGVVLQDLVLRNAQPVHILATANAIDFGHASFIAKDTTLDATGRLALNSKTPWDMAIQGRINFSILQLFNPDLLGAGASIINVTIRGPLTEPQVQGRLELKDASLFLRDVPNGVDNANGLILFDRNRATVQELSGKSGGGDVSFESGSFLGFRGEALVYRLQATARNVRYRSPDGISVTADGSMALVGTSESSVLSGAVSVTRAAFNPRTDVGALLAATTTPVAAEPNEYLQGVQLDVRVLTQHTLEVETSLTRNIQADADLRVRGTPDRPILLGHVTVNSGQIEFFGNKYSINRGEITFNNPAKIEPVINMDLSTKVRGITVDVSFSGSLNKLNFSYRSDPPLEASDIVALLAVGRTPSTAGPLATSQATTNMNNSYLGMGTGSNSLLSQAIAPNSGRLQKFFGVSHIKIDPQLTDVTIVPQARLTMEQQVSSDVTLTYITNLAVTNQQIVRVQWDFSRKWSAVALRDENGAFSIDFQYRKRFK